MKLPRRKAEVSLDDRLEALAEAADLAEGRLGQEAVDHARAVVARAGARRGLSVEHTAVALAGATGSGKSSLFNALSGTELATVGVTRPTTAKAQAALWGPDGSGPLLDWLDVPLRHTVEGDATGLILLDLPDHDSIELSHRREVDRLVAAVDLLVWVLDPQKYADAAVHERYLGPLARHRDVMVVVLNQVDRLPERSVKRCLDDLRGLLAADGLEGVPVLGVSARTGEGVPELRALLDRQVSLRRAWSSRLAADVASAASELWADTPPAPGQVAAPEAAVTRALTRALAQAAGVPAAVEAVAKSHRHRSIAATGWPVTRWLRRLRPDPLRRLHLAKGARSSLPAATAVEVSAVDTALRDVGAAASASVPEPWATAVRHAARSRSEELTDALDRTVAAAISGRVSSAPRWWRVAGTAQWLTVAAMAGGAIWLLVRFALDYLMLPGLPTPTVGRAPWPTVLLLGGALAGVLIAALCRVFAWAGGRRRARRAAKALRAGIEQVAGELIVAPTRDELSRYTRFADRVALAAS
ncbi:YfjP family GTPase [Microbispora sp. KK1-11]|uniref:YfjP family GTPase n=1 Tax=Microbispora sp. KK1-11 TaxID=2053005 RepID=UPI00115A580A|nr:YfjP family GTPase [Microbispora sp. KK1-11]TQS25393.1 ABC transporter [Microbispora sp. KK1-11]